ncbi:hypothetical protein [Psychrobacter sp.]|uniref:hypothetical protein n=1 Tax=Psychrobacter sp. TaxID=56811 RepID=UPI003F952887
MATQRDDISIWQQMIQQSCLSLFEVSENDTVASEDHFQGYDFVFEFSGAVIYLLVNDVVEQEKKEAISRAKIRKWRLEAVNQLIKRHAQLYIKSDLSNAEDDALRADKEVYFVGLTALSVESLEAEAASPTYAIGHEYGSQFFAEDCVLDLDDERSVLQVFSYQNFIDILSQLVTPSDLSVFLRFHRNHLTEFKSFQNESSLLAHFLESAEFYQRAIAIQEKLVEIELVNELEPRLLKAVEPGQIDFSRTLMAHIQKNTRMWYKLFNNLIKDSHKAGSPLPKDQVATLVDESMYTYACLVEKIIAYRTFDQDSRWHGCVRHEHSYHVFGRHYMMVFYAQDDNSSLSMTQVRQSHQDLLAELNAKIQDPVLNDLFLIGVEFRPCEDSVNTEVHLDIFHQAGAAIDSNTQRLYQQLADLKSQL